MNLLDYKWPLFLLLIASLVVTLIDSIPTGDGYENEADDYLNVEKYDDDYNDDDASFHARFPWGSGRQAKPFPKLGLANGCGLSPARRRLGKRLIEGVNVTYGEFPSYVRLTIGLESDTISCGGTLISDRHVLTAAHCLSKLLNGEPILIRLADHQFGHKDTFEMVVRARQTFCNDPQFFEVKKKTVHDWIVILLKKRIRFNDYIQPACMPRASIPRTKGPLSRCYQVGMGAVGFEDYSKPAKEAAELAIPSEWLQKVRVEQVDCPLAYNVSANDPSRVCYKRADERVGPFACFGDSGSPVLCQDDQDRWTIVAITSYVTYDYCGTHPKYIRNNYPAFFADVVRLLPEMDDRCKYVLEYSSG